MAPKSLLGSLFDFSFTEFITTRIISILFILGVVVSGLGALGFIISGFASSVGRGILFLILSPIIFLIHVLIARIWCEIVIVVFRIAENTGRLVDQNRPDTP
ncbi:MAG: DUF4282 domain-containing protein [Candidatus Tectomicrobia bacterium]|nr:DUF4282 domain-containing protein [Candidatus Tectomicrobia bacterium]